MLIVKEFTPPTKMLSVSSRGANQTLLHGIIDATTTSDNKINECIIAYKRIRVWVLLR